MTSRTKYTYVCTQFIEFCTYCTNKSVLLLFQPLILSHFGCSFHEFFHFILSSTLRNSKWIQPNEVLYLNNFYTCQNQFCILCILFTFIKKLFYSLLPINTLKALFWKHSFMSYVILTVKWRIHKSRFNPAVCRVILGAFVQDANVCNLITSPTSY